MLNHAGAEYRIAPATQKRVLEAAAACNYHPNAFASGLRKKRSFTVGVMVPEISEGYSAAVLSGIEDALLEEKFFYFVVSHRHRDDLLREYPRLLQARGVEGIIAVDTPLPEAPPIPAVAVSGHRGKTGILTIEIDHLAAARYALTHLADLGHRRIAFIKGQRFSSDTKARWQAIRTVCPPSASPSIPIWSCSSKASPPAASPATSPPASSSPAAAASLPSSASTTPPPSAPSPPSTRPACTSPVDVSVIGFDDIPAAATIRPALTTVRQPLVEMGRTAAVTLLRLIREDVTDQPQRSILVSPTFIRRQSTERAAAH